MIGLIAGLVAVEGLLQLGALFVAADTPDQQPEFHTDRIRVVCIGDSNVYGLGVSRLETFPSLLQKIWNHTEGVRKVEVLNLGFPGLNSSKLRRNFRPLLAAVRPDLVIVLVGSNDITSVAVPIEGAAGDASIAYRLWQRSRLFRLLYMLVTGMREGQVKVDVRYDRNSRRGTVRAGGGEFDLAGTDRSATAPPDWHLALEANLEAMAADSAASGAKFVVLTYPSHLSMYGSANLFIVRVDAPLIDLAAAFGSLCPDGICPDLFQPDQHPTARGNELMAQVVFDGLIERGLVATLGAGTR